MTGRSTVVRGCRPTVSSPSMNAQPPAAPARPVRPPRADRHHRPSPRSSGAGLGGVALANRDDPDPPRRSGSARRRVRRPPRPRRADGRAEAPTESAPAADDDHAVGDRRHHHGQRAQQAAGQRRQGLLRPVQDGAEVRPGDGQPRAAAHRRHRHLQVRLAGRGPTASRSARRRRTPSTSTTPASSCSTRRTTTPRTSGGQGYTEHGRRRWRAPGSSTPAPTDQITVVEVKGVKVAVVGFSSYAGANNLTDLDRRRARWSQKAAGQADLVVVQVHMGAEGSDKTHVKPGTEIFFGENRGDPIKFSKRGHRRRRRPGRRARAARAARHGVLQGQADRVQPGQLRRWRQDAQQRRAC